MLQIDDTIVSLDVIEKQFCCPLAICKGACCVDGDSGAPLEAEEILDMEQALPAVLKLLSPKAREIIQENGVAVIDSDGDLVTPLVYNKECVFTVFENGIASCAIEKCWEKGMSKIRKPISCHLYPVRITKYAAFTAINYHAWDVCKPASELGAKQGIRVYELVKEALITRFGAEWYQKLTEGADYILKMKRNEIL